MKTVIFGGTFNPFHNGHMQLSREVIKKISPDRFIIMPAHIPPHKQAEELMSDEDRLTMCRLAAKELGLKAEVSDYEIKRGGKSYSVFTLEHFKELYPSDTLYFAMGSDMLKSFFGWYRADRIMELCTLVCNCRDERDREDIKAEKERIESAGGKCILTECDALVCSSTEIRKKIAAGLPITDSVPIPVAEYIIRKGLYRD